MNELKHQLNKPFFDEQITPKTKKYTVYVAADNKKGYITVHFGARKYAHYYDKIGHWSKLNHLDHARRERYRARHEKIKKDGLPAYKNKKSAEYWAWNYLW